MRKFFKQVYNSGIARINLYKKYPDSLKLVHLLPTVFTVGVILLFLLACAGRVMMVYGETADFYLWYWFTIGALSPILLFSLLIFIDSSIRNRSTAIGFISIGAAFVQLFGYGLGFIESWWRRCVMKKESFQAFEKNFYD